MNCRSLLAVLAVVPSLASAQMTIGRPQTQIARPQMIAMREPALYVFDHYKVNGTDFLMHYMDDITGTAHSSEPFTGGIQGMASDRMGNVYAAVWVGPSEPTYVMHMKKVGRFTGPLKRATALTTDYQGRIYITDGELGQIIRIDDLNGTNLVVFGSRGTGIGQFVNPSGIAVDRAGHIYVADYGNNRIVRIDDMNGEGWRTYNGAAYGGLGLQVEGAKSIALDSKGRLYYVRSDNGYVIRVDDMSGSNMVRWGGAAGPAGSGYFLVEPTSIAIDSNDRIYLADRGAGMVTRIDDMTGANRTVLFKDASGNLWKRPELLAVFYPRADRTIIR